MGILLLILCMVLFFKFIGFLLRITGKIIGGIFSLVGFAVIGVIAVAVLGITLRALPVILILGIIAIIFAAKKA